MLRRHWVLLNFLFIFTSSVLFSAPDNTQLPAELERLKWSYGLLKTIEGIDVTSDLRREIKFCLQNHTLPEGDLFNQLLVVSQGSRLTNEQAKTFLESIENYLKAPNDKAVSDDLLHVLREVHHEIQHQRIEISRTRLASIRVLKNTGLLMWKASEISEDFYHVNECLDNPTEAPVNHGMNSATLDEIRMFLYLTATESDLEQRLIVTRLLMIRHLLYALEQSAQFMARYNFLYREFLELIEIFHDEIKYQYSVQEAEKVAELREAQRRSAERATDATPTELLMKGVDFTVNPDGTLSLVVPEETLFNRVADGFQKAWNHFMLPSRHELKQHESTGDTRESWLRRARRFIKP